MKITLFLLLATALAACGQTSRPDYPTTAAADINCTPAVAHPVLDLLDPDPDCEAAQQRMGGLDGSADSSLARGMYAQHCQENESAARGHYRAAIEAGAACRGRVNITTLSSATRYDFDVALESCGACPNAEQTQALSLNTAIWLQEQGDACDEILPHARAALSGPEPGARVNALGVVISCDSAPTMARYAADLRRLRSAVEGVDRAILYGLAVALTSGVEQAACARQALVSDDGSDPDWTAELGAAAAVHTGGVCPIDSGP